jgi:hypothetical protein
MAEEAQKYEDFADEYFVEYGIPDDRAVQRTTFVIMPIVVPSIYFNIGIFDEVVNMFPETIEHADKAGTKLSEWDDIGQIDMLIADILNKGIRIPEMPKLKNYLSNFPDLIEILPSVCKLTRDRFPHNAQLSLEIDRDIQGKDELILYVRQDHYEEDFMDTIEDIRARYSDKLIGKKGWILVTTDFSSPE